MTDVPNETTRKTLPCGCQVDAARDFLGRVVGKVVAKGETCAPGDPRARTGRGDAGPRARATGIARFKFKVKV